jgi:SynChlorMet cassette radical SAM/SPASM protein ScmE
MSTPRSLDLDITNYCNLRCKYCSHFTSAGDVKQDLPTEKWLDFFQELNRCGIMTVCLQGGEPFYRKDLPELIEGIVRNRMRFNMLSNGTLISDEAAAFLASTNRCDGVQISIDGSDDHAHDVFRGNGSFSKALKGIEFLRKHTVPVSVRVTLHKKNIHDLENIARLLLEDLGLPEFTTNAASYMGLCRENVKEVQLTASERTRAMEKLLVLNRKYNGRLSATAGPLAEAINWMMIEQACREGKESLPGGGYLTGCSGPMSSLAVRADGVIVPCAQLSHIELGRVGKNDLKKIWQHHPELKRLRDRHNIPLDDFEFCKDCDYISYCTGNCSALAYTITGQVNHPSPDACLRNFFKEGGKLPLYRQWPEKQQL